MEQTSGQSLKIYDALNLALSLHKNNQIEEARYIYQRVVMARPDLPDPWHLLGLIESEQKNYRYAIYCMKNAVIMAPEYARYHTSLGHALFFAYYFDAAVTAFYNATQLPDTPEEAAENLESARKRVQAAQHMQSIISRRPIYLALETTTLCNSRCVFCVYRKIKRQKTIMTMALFEKICCEYEVLGGGYIGFNPLLSDPLVDPFFMERIRYLADHHPRLIPHVFTNAIGFSRFSDAEITFILSHCDYIDISLGGVNRDDYLTMFGVDRFDTVWAQLQRIGHINADLGFPCGLNIHIRTHRLRETTADPALQELRVFGFHICGIINSFANWGGELSQAELPPGATVAEPDQTQHDSTCTAPEMYFSILPDGRVVACSCMDARESVVVGNITTESMEKIWTGPTMQAFRHSFAHSDTMYAMCQKCSYYTPARRMFSTPKLIDYRVRYDIWRYLE